MSTYTYPTEMNLAITRLAVALHPNEDGDWTEVELINEAAERLRMGTGPRYQRSDKPHVCVFDSAVPGVPAPLGPEGSVIDTRLYCRCGKFKDFPIMIEEEKGTFCFHCGSQNMIEELREQDIPICIGDHFRKATMPVFICVDCGYMWTDEKS